MDGTIAKAFGEAGPGAYLLVAVSAMALAVVLERAFYLWFRNGIRADVFMEHLMKLLAAGNRDRALKLCDAVPGVVLLDVVGQGLRGTEDRIDRGAESLQKARAERTPQLYRRLSRLPLLAAAAAAVGAGTTVWNWNRTHPEAADAASLAREALAGWSSDPVFLPALAGLAVAAFCLVAWALFRARAASLDRAIERCVDALIVAVRSIRTW
jgi:biopolymer transport protein ExbB/TolQ